MTHPADGGDRGSEDGRPPLEVAIAGLPVEFQHLVRAALAVAGRAYAPYSGFRVGAAVLGGSGRIHAGCNVENASYPVGLCAERNAVGTAVAEAEPRIVAVAVAPADPSVRTLTPCGMCRQFLAEFGSDLPVAILEGGAWVVRPISALLPAGFTLPAGGE